MTNNFNSSLRGDFRAVEIYQGYKKTFKSLTALASSSSALIIFRSTIRKSGVAGPEPAAESDAAYSTKNNGEKSTSARFVCGDTLNTAVFLREVGPQ